MPIPKSWTFFFLAVLALVVAILVTRPDGPAPEDAGEQALEETRGTTFTGMLEQGGNAVYVEDQLSGTLAVRVGFVVLSAPGFVVIFNDAGGVPGTAIGASNLLAQGGEHLVVPLEGVLQESQIYYAMLYHDNGDGKFDAQTDAQAADSQDSVVLMSFSATEEAAPESEAVLP
ncbi:hypothetical protein HY631_01845 [Candidatus Uhrbacteria bacterium]|nr:hypothetical protein [Candidatus Uhrbacteria bacterium]